MAADYTPNKWELYDPTKPNEEQPHSFITKRKLDRSEQGSEEASIDLEIGEIKTGDKPEATIVEDHENKTKKLNITFPNSGKGEKGDDGKSAYDIWLENGNIGTEQEFLDYLKGIDGKDGKDGINGKDGEPGPSGESAYQIWLSQGNTGTEQDFLYSLKGEKGDEGDEGDSAYELWKSLPGNDNKSITEFFESLKGEKGDKGDSGGGSVIEFVDF